MRSILARTRATSCGTRYPRPKRRSARLRVQRVLMQGSSGIGLRLSHHAARRRASQSLPEAPGAMAGLRRIPSNFGSDHITSHSESMSESRHVRLSRPPSRVLAGPSRCPTCVALAAQVSTWHPCARRARALDEWRAALPLGGSRRRGRRASHHARAHAHHMEHSRELIWI